MDNAALYFTIETLTRILFPLLYGLAALVVYRCLMPACLPVCQRLASALLAAQALAISKAIFMGPFSAWEEYQWNLHQEWNVPAMIASMQLALVGGVALLCAWHYRPRRAFGQLYMLVIALAFLYLAYDEYYVLHELLISWDVFIFLGLILVAATLLAAAVGPRRSWKWYACMVVGLVIAGAGEIGIDQVKNICGDYGWLRLAQCPADHGWDLEEILAFLGIWLALVAMLGFYSDLSPPTRRAGRVLSVILGLWFLFLTHYVPRGPVDLIQIGEQRASVEFETGTSLFGHSVKHGDSSIVLSLPDGALPSGLGYSVHLVDQLSGETVFSHNDNVRLTNRVWFNRLIYIFLYRQKMELEIPPDYPANRALWVALTLWREQDGKYQKQRVTASDRQLLSDTQVVLGELLLPLIADPFPAGQLALFDIGYTLYETQLPASATIGASLPVTFSWASALDSHEDYVQFLHFGHDESGEWWVYDQQPLGARLPTRLWYSGLMDSETWQVPLPADLAPGRFSIYTGLYRSSDRERVPASDVNGVPFVDARVPLGTLIIES